jgi:hypothetical protein
VPYADGLELIIDRATGILMQVRPSIEGAEFMRWELVELEVGRPLDDALFEGPPEARLPPGFPDAFGRSTGH